MRQKMLEFIESLSFNELQTVAEAAGFNAEKIKECKQQEADNILLVLAGEYNITIGEIREVAKRRTQVWCRHLAMYILKSKGYKEEEIGRLIRPLNPLDRATVIHGLKQIDNTIFSDKKKAEQIDEIIIKVNQLWTA